MARKKKESKPSFEIEENGNDNNGDGDGDDGNAGDSGSRRSGGSGDGFGVGINDASGRSSTDGGTSHEFGELLYSGGVDDDESASGREQPPRRATGRGRNRRRGSSARPATGNEGNETEQGTSSASGAAPRKIGFGSLGGNAKSKTSAKDAALTSAFLAEVYGLVFHFIGTWVDDEEWRLPAEDAEELGERTQRCLAMLGAKNFAQVQMLLGKFQPPAALGMSLIAVIGARVKHTRDKRRHAVNPPEKAKADRGTKASAPVSETPSDVASPRANGANSEYRGPERWDGVSFGRHAWEQAIDGNVS